MKTGRILSAPASSAPARAWLSFFAPSTRCTIIWSVHQYQMPRIGAPKKMPVHGNAASVDGLIMWK